MAGEVAVVQLEESRKTTYKFKSGGKNQKTEENDIKDIPQLLHKSCTKNN